MQNRSCLVAFARLVLLNFGYQRPSATDLQLSCCLSYGGAVTLFKV